MSIYEWDIFLLQYGWNSFGKSIIEIRNKHKNFKRFEKNILFKHKKKYNTLFIKIMLYRIMNSILNYLNYLILFIHINDNEINNYCLTF